MGKNRPRRSSPTMSTPRPRRLNAPKPGQFQRMADQKRARYLPSTSRIIYSATATYVSNSASSASAGFCATSTQEAFGYAKWRAPRTIANCKTKSVNTARPAICRTSQPLQTGFSPALGGGDTGARAVGNESTIKGSDGFGSLSNGGGSNNGLFGDDKNSSELELNSLDAWLMRMKAR